LATGRVLQFDPVRGYGFVGAGDGGEDVFLHASVFDGDPGELVPGTRVEFNVMEGDRGRKAFAVRLLGEESPGGKRPPTPASVIPAQAGPAQTDLAQTGPAQAGPVSAAARIASPPAAEDEQLCDVLSRVELTQDITEMLLNAAPVLSGQQILQVRQGVLEFAVKHGWVDA
jgi:cold shock protein